VIVIAVYWMSLSLYSGMAGIGSMSVRWRVRVMYFQFHSSNRSMPVLAETQ